MKNSSKKKSKKFYLIFHVSTKDTSMFYDVDSLKIIGIYESKKLAEQAISRLLEAEGFCDGHNSFLIEPFTGNKNYWPNGFTLNDNIEIDPPYKSNNQKFTLPK